MKHTTSVPARGARIATNMATGLAAAFLFACADNSMPTNPSHAASTASLGRVPPKQDRIVFQGNRDYAAIYDIYSMLPDGTGITRLTTSILDNWYPALSPDRKHVVFTSKGENGLGDIYIMDSDGANLKRLTRTRAANYHPTWSADGTKIVFTSTRNAADPSAVQVGASWEIYIMNSDGSNQTRVTNDNVGEFEPQLSPDGTQIVFASDRDHLDSDVICELYVMNVDGTNIHRLTSQDGRVNTPSFDPSGTRILYNVSIGSAPGIYVYTLGHRAPTRVSFNVGGGDATPAWSPDGRQIVYSHWVGTNGGEIFTMNADGTNMKQLTNDLFADFYPRWGR